MYPELNLEGLRELRAKLGDIIKLIDSQKGSRELSIVKTKLQEGKMWLGMEMGNVGGEDLNAKRDKELNETPTDKVVDDTQTPEKPE